MLNHFFMEEGFVQNGKKNIQRRPCILLSVDFTLHKINLFISTKIFSGERMIILHAGFNEGFVPNARKIIL